MLAELKKALLNFDEAVDGAFEGKGLYDEADIRKFIETTFSQFEQRIQAIDSTDDLQSRINALIREMFQRDHDIIAELNKQIEKITAEKDELQRYLLDKMSG